MGARIRELEEALRHTRVDKTDDSHPSLSSSASLASQSSLEKLTLDTAHNGASSLSEPESDSFIDALGISSTWCFAVRYDDAVIRNSHNRHPRGN